MFRLSEAVKINNNKIFNLNFHNIRMNEARRNLYGCKDIIDLSDHIRIPDNCRSGIFKCRIIYDTIVREINFIPYKRKIVTSLKIIEENNINYKYKFENKDIFHKLLDQRENCDDILIIKDGKITDTSFSNIVFFDGCKWITPDTPLLNGTKRTSLLMNGVISEDVITYEKLRNYEKASLINAMLDLEETVVDIRNIFR